MRCYFGVRHEGGRTDVLVSEGASLTPLAHCPGLPPPARAPYDWGAVSPGAVRLASAVLFDVFANERLARLYADDFVKDVLAWCASPAFLLSGESTVQWVVDRCMDDLSASRRTNGEGGK